MGSVALVTGIQVGCNIAQWLAVAVGYHWSLKLGGATARMMGGWLLVCVAHSAFIILWAILINRSRQRGQEPGGLLYVVAMANVVLMAIQTVLAPIAGLTHVDFAVGG